MTDFTLKIGGEAGQGIASSGLIFDKLALRSGYFVFDSNEYPSLIRGGHNIYTTRVSDQKMFSLNDGVDFLIALDQNTIDLHENELSSRAIVILNSDKYSNPLSKNGVNVFLIPLTKLAKDAGGSDVMMNNVALGAAAFFLKADFTILESVIRDVFISAKPEIIDLNIKSAKAGFDFAKNNFNRFELAFNLSIFPYKGAKFLLSGNDAICLGAIKAGCKFFAAYPMTPINSIIAYFAAKAKELNMVYFQPEDEIAAINSAIGAASAGVRSMTATSGGGFSLMVEALGMAGMTETPLVIINGQRPGPSSGLPTWTGQGDLKFVLAAGQDDFPRLVLAPGDIEECFWMTAEAFNLADKYQVPVIILTDKYLSESRQSTVIFDESRIKIDRGLLLSKKDQRGDFKRYAFAENGISPWAIIGRQGNPFLINSYEHDENGFSIEDSETKTAMMEKRMKKLEIMEKEMPKPMIYGNKRSDFLLIGWGSTKGSILEAQKILEEEGVKTKFLHLNHLNPFPKEEVVSAIKNSKKVLLIEGNIAGQLGDLIEQKTGMEIKEKLLKYDGRPFSPEEITARVKTMV